MKETRFKDTEVGLIPEDWEVKVLGSHSDIYRGGSPRPIDAYLTEHPSGINWIKIGDVQPGDKYIRKTVEKIIQSGASHSRRVSPGDFILSNSMSFGRPYIMAIDGCIHDGWLVIQNYQATYDKEFLYYNLASGPVVNQYKIMAAGSSVQNLNKDKVASVKIIAPLSLLEQTRIASALTSIDNLLSSLEKLIAKKKDIKQGTMQQLLTGKKRLNGFTEPWVEKSLNSVFEFKKGNGLSKEKIVSDGINFCMLYGEIFTRFNYVTKGDFYRTNYSEGTPSKKDDILMPGSTTTNGFDLVKAVAIDTEGVRLGGDIIILRKRKNDVNAYFWASLISEIEKQKIADKTQGITIFHLHAKNLIDIKYRVPSTCEEQTAIASVLTAMDNEIAALEARRAKYESIKQGMMQQLLTGKIRLVETAAKTNTITANVHFRRSVLAAEIADRLCEEPTFGHVKMEKMLFLTERLCHIDIGSHYHRDAAGPYDNNALRSIDSQLRKQKWFEVQQTEKGYKYVAMPNRGKHKTYFDKYYSNVLPMFDKIINTFKTQRTEQCEIVATLYSAWEDLIHKNQPFTDADIVNEVLNNWHESKKRISRERWHESIQWMRNNGFAPNNISI